MTWLGLQRILEGAAQISVERVLNSLPEGMLIALFAWLLLRVVGRQNAGTRFAVLITALIAVAGLPFLAGFDSVLERGHSLLSVGAAHPRITVSLFWIVPISIFWAAGACVAIVRLIAGLQRVSAIRRNCTVIDPTRFDPSLKEQVQKALEESHISRPIAIAESDRVRVPAVIGFLNPMIVFPSWTLRELSPGELNVIFIHELAHLRRRDCWTNLLQKIVRAVFFFHPAVWWIDARLSLEREMACDDAVLAKTGDPRAYASCLVGLLERSCARRGWTMAQTAVHRTHEASLRISRILDPRRPTTTRARKIAPGLVGVFSVACIGVVLFVPQLMIFSPGAPALTVHSHKTTYVRAMTASDMYGTVIPAAFHPHAPAGREMTARHTAPHHSTPAAVRAAEERKNATDFPLAGKFVMVQTDRATSIAPMLVFADATEIDPGSMVSDGIGGIPARQAQTERDREPVQSGLVQTIQYGVFDGTTWRVQVWRLVLMVPSPAELRAGVKEKSI
jgi:beta-lactamase regulating signal transducer with metallopeptidase domain